MDINLKTTLINFTTWIRFWSPLTLDSKPNFRPISSDGWTYHQADKLHNAPIWIICVTRYARFYGSGYEWRNNSLLLSRRAGLRFSQNALHGCTRSKTCSKICSGPRASSVFNCEEWRGEKTGLVATVKLPILGAVKRLKHRERPSQRITHIYIGPKLWTQNYSEPFFRAFW